MMSWMDFFLLWGNPSMSVRSARYPLLTQNENGRVNPKSESNLPAVWQLIIRLAWGSWSSFLAADKSPPFQYAFCWADDNGLCIWEICKVALEDLIYKWYNIDYVYKYVYYYKSAFNVQGTFYSLLMQPV